MINGMGDAGAIEAERAGMAKEFGVTAIYSGAYMTRPDEPTPWWSKPRRS
jgi:3-hydroxybutyrate dehydrogenase